MDTHTSEQESVQTNVPSSQTGSPQAPLQVENVQYGVRVGSFFTRMSLAFIVASTSLVVLVILAAWSLHGLVLQQIIGVSYAGSPEDVAKRFVLLVSFAIPLIPLFFFSSKKLNVFMEDPALREDIVFKKRLRFALWSEIILAVLSIAGGVYQGLNVLLLGGEGNVLEGFSTALFYGGAFVLLAWWSYSFQKRTVR